MAASQDDDDLQLIRASASLLDDLAESLPCLLWKAKPYSRVHNLVRKRDLDHVIQLIEPFQAEPQLLDSRLKIYLPTIINAYLSYLQLPSPKPTKPGTIALDAAASSVLYTFCKVRGEKVVTGFFNNEPKYLNLILRALEACAANHDTTHSPWEVPYILLLWLTHLLLAPFDLSSISNPSENCELQLALQLPSELPSLSRRLLAVGLHYIGSATKEQDAASKLLVRLAVRPDMQKLRLPSSLVSWALNKLATPDLRSSSNIHDYLGPLRFLVGMSACPDSEDTLNLMPSVYASTRRLMDDAMFAFLTTSAVAQKLMIKLFRNIAILSLQPNSDHLTIFFDQARVLEDTIDCLLQLLGARDTPVRFAASKAMSMIVLRLEPSLAHEVVQAILDSMKEDLPLSFSEKDFSTVNTLRWHGLTLSLAHALFRRSASPAQLPEIVNALLLALTFEQRSTTGSSNGSNVRDAACFGIWSFSRRYSTAELLSVNARALRAEDGIPHAQNSAIQLVGVHLLLAACLDPAGNIRRGSSAALQELIGRHPDQVSHGIALVQVVDYNAVGLRQRAAIDVAYKSSALDPIYRHALVTALLGWRGLGSPDAASRETAAISIAQLCEDQCLAFVAPVGEHIAAHMSDAVSTNVEGCHGAFSALSKVVNMRMEHVKQMRYSSDEVLTYLAGLWHVFENERKMFLQYSPRSLKAELSPAVAQAITSLALLTTSQFAWSKPNAQIKRNVSVIFNAMATRSERSLLDVLPAAVSALTRLFCVGESPPQPFDAAVYITKIRSDSSATVLHGAGRAIALAAAFPALQEVYRCDPGDVVQVITQTIESAQSTEWRVIALQSLLLVIASLERGSPWLKEVVNSLHIALNDYTITERGDVGSLVRAAALTCVEGIWKLDSVSSDHAADTTLLADVVRLSLEKLDRIRLQADRCLEVRETHKDVIVCPSTSSAIIEPRKSLVINDTLSVVYFYKRLQPLADPTTPTWEHEAILRGCVSSGGAGSEALLQSVRSALTEIMYANANARLISLPTLAMLLKSATAPETDTQPILELLAHLLDTVPALLEIENFSWRNLLALVQKSHFKSSNIPKIVAAVRVYQGLADCVVIRSEVLKKLVSMLRTNPYAKVRIAVSECLFVLNGDQRLKGIDWGKPGNKYIELFRQ